MNSWHAVCEQQAYPTYELVIGVYGNQLLLVWNF